MNWELSSIISHKCPCGRGTYSVRTFLDDWRRAEEQWDMNCSECRGKYELHSSANLKTGRLLRSNRWIRRGSLHSDGLSMIANRSGAGDKELRKQRDSVKAKVLELQNSKPRMVKNGFPSRAR
jgi:hypothetical protein